MMGRRAQIKFTPEERSAWAMLQRARPLIEWHRPSLRGADLTGTGETSRVMVGADDDGATWIGIAHPGREGGHNPAVFAVAEVVSLSFEKLERAEDWLFDGQFPLAGCRPRRGMRLLRVVAESAGGAVTLMYWNAEEKRFDAWTAPARPSQEPLGYEDLDTTG